MTTQIQKAIAIAKRDGFELHKTGLVYNIPNKYNRSKTAESLLESYATDLNYLIPIAVKVLKEISTMTDSKDNLDLFNAYCGLHDAYSALNIDSKNQYTELFEALYEAIRLFENE